MKTGHLPLATTAYPANLRDNYCRTILERFAPLAELAQQVAPVVGEVGVRSMINGPIPYSADGDFVMGWVPGMDNLMLATGFLYGIAAGGGAGEMIAQWIVEGEPPLDLWPLGCSPIQLAPWHQGIHVPTRG